jgi:methylaspartate mutase epsilon subunit
LQEFPALLHGYRLKDDQAKLWYLGGNLSVSESDFAVKKKFLGMGFTNVYPKPVAFDCVLDDIRRDVERHNIPKRRFDYTGRYGNRVSLPRGNTDELPDKQWEVEDFTRMRHQVLHEWDNGVDHFSAGDPLPVPFRQSHSTDHLLWQHRAVRSQPLLQPRAGVADIEKQISLSQFLEQAGSAISSVQIDAASRSGLYDKAKKGLELSIARKTSLLNGFPVAVHGVKAVNRLVRAVGNPFQVRSGGPDQRLNYEIALMAGMSSMEGGAISYLMPYDKHTPPAQSIRNWQYVDRLCARYEELHRVSVNRETFGTLTATLIPPCLAIAVNVIETLLCAQQGVKSITVGYAEQGNRLQDIAALHVLEEMVYQYLDRYHFTGCRITTVYHQYMAAFPADGAKAADLIFNSAITAALAGATKVMVKTAVESFKIPDQHDNAGALDLCKKAVALAKPELVDQKRLAVEKELLRREVRQIMEVVIELGDGRIVAGALRAIEEGIIDIPWSPNLYNKNKVCTLRDTDGAVRFSDFGHLPFDEKVREFHQDKIHVRETMERSGSAFALLEKDLSRIWKNDFRAWPLDGHYVI